jgi:hypothetical protein
MRRNSDHHAEADCASFSQQRRRWLDTMLAQLPELVRDRVSEPEKASEVRPLADVLREIFRP